VRYTGPLGSLFAIASAVDRGRDLLGMAQLEVPLHELAQHAALVEVLLRPVDVVVARAGNIARLGKRRPSRREQHRDLLPCGVDDAVHAVGGAHADMDHHRLSAAAHHGVAVHHGHAHVLVRHDHRLRHLPAERLPLGIGFDDRREIGAAVGEQIVHAARGERAGVGLGGGLRFESEGQVGFHARMLNPQNRG
jgi:hypothetical protein